MPTSVLTPIARLTAGVALAFFAAGCAGDDVPPGAKRVAHEGPTGTVAQSLFVMKSVTWPTPSNIPVCWETAGFAAEKEWVKDAQQISWEKAAPAIKFTGWGACTSTSKGIRITVRTDEEGPHVKDLGKRLDGMPQGMVLDFKLNGDPLYQAQCLSSAARKERCIRSIAVHEFGHALGFLHEQDRQDTPQSCDQASGEPQEPGSSTIGAWDAMSIMNYCYPNRDTVFPIALSPTDIKGVRELYPGGASGDEESADETGDSTSSTKAKKSSDDEEEEDEEEEDEEEATPVAATGCSVPSRGASRAAGSVFALGALAVASVVARRRRAPR